MTYTTATPVRILLDDAISEYISDTGDAPHYREHLLDLLESAVQAEPQDTVTPGTVQIDDETAMALIYGAGSSLSYPENYGSFGAAMVRLCETTLQAIPEERRNELMSKLDAEDDSTPPQDTVTISREDAEFIVAKLWVTDRSLFARSGEIQDRIKAQLTQEEPA